MQNHDKQNPAIGIFKNVWHNSKFLKYSGLIIFIIGIGMCLGGVLYSSLSGMNLHSPREEISKILMMIGIGIPSIFVGMNVILKPARRTVYLMAPGIILSSICLAIFYMNYMEKWYYPLVGYVSFFYILGVLLLIVVLFDNTAKKEIKINSLKEDGYLALKGKLNLQVTKIQELQDDLQKFQIDFEGYGWGISEERKKAEKLLFKLLQIVDGCEPFLKSTEGDSDAINRIRAIHNQSQNILKAEGVRIIDPKPGDNFDPHEHEIENRNDNLSEDVMIKDVTRIGYKGNSAIFRKAWVVVENKYEKR